MTPRALFSLLFHADKALDLVRTALDLGLTARLDAGPVTLGALAEATGARPLRLFKFLDGLESLGLVVREQSTDDPLTASYISREPLTVAAQAVLGPQSIERDRNAYPWTEIHGRLDDVLHGQLDTRFAWPPASAEEVQAFEVSMAVGSAPIVEALRDAHRLVFASPRSDCRWLDVGGGDGAVGAALLAEDRRLTCGVFNLPPVAPLVRARARDAGLNGRLGFIGGDFLRDPLPAGYDVLSFIRVLHDWPADTARHLLRQARRALAAGGRIVICEEFRTRDRLAVQFFWTYFLIGADECHSRLREATWYTDALDELGFRDIQVIPGEFDLITASV